MLFLTLKVQFKLFEEIFDSHFPTETDTIRVKCKFDARSGQILRQFYHLFFQTVKQVLVDGNYPFFQFEGCIFIEKDNLVILIDDLFQIDQILMSGHL